MKKMYVTKHLLIAMPRGLKKQTGLFQIKHITFANFFPPKDPSGPTASTSGHTTSQTTSATTGSSHKGGIPTWGI